MRGINVTPEQFEAAKVFIESLMRQPPPGTLDDVVSQRYEDFIRLVAWYGAIRYQGAKNGIGTFEVPGGTGKVDASV